jgi:hypothetical protein
MKSINPRLFELISIIVFAITMQLILNYVTDCELKALTLMAITGMYCIWITNRTNNIK